MVNVEESLQQLERAIRSAEGTYHSYKEQQALKDEYEEKWLSTKSDFWKMKFDEQDEFTTEMYQTYQARSRQVRAHIADFDVGTLTSAESLIKFARLRKRAARFSRSGTSSGGKVSRLIADYKPKNTQDALTLLSYFKEKHEVERAVDCVREAFQRLGGDTLRQKLLDLLEETGNTDELVRFQRENAETPEGFLTLISYLEQAGKTKEALTAAREGFQRFGDQRLELKVEILEDQAKKQRARHFLKLKQVGKALDYLDTEITKGANLHLYRRSFLYEGLPKEGQEVRQAVVSFLQEKCQASENLDDVQNFLEGMADFTVKEALPLVWQALEHPAPVIRASAAEALCSFASTVSREQVKALAQKAQTEEDYKVRKKIMRALAIIDYDNPRTWWEKLFGRRPWMEIWEH